jgi:exonuclease III
MMKLVSFNIWGGTIYGPLTDYLGKLSADTDIFCFQEVFSGLPGAPEESAGGRMFLFQELGVLLKEFTGFFEPRSTGFDFSNEDEGLPVSHGLAIFVRKNLSVVNYRSEIVEQTNSAEDPVEGWVKVQTLTLENQGKRLSIINFHGVGQPGNKLDTPQRAGHAKKLQLIWDSLLDSAKILCGDFNLNPDTESIKMLETKGKNLIKEFNIQNTRNEISWKRYNNIQHFADYTFVSPEVKVKNFEVPYNEVSDHLPMILEFSL